MSDVTRILAGASAGDPRAAAELLPLVYDELRKLAAARMAAENPSHTLEPTALVHEAYLRLVDPVEATSWNGRGHFFAAAAEAMRRILVENARRKSRIRHGGGMQRIDWQDPEAPKPTTDEELLDLDAALERLERRDSKRAELVKLRFFAGLPMAEVAAALGISLATAERQWVFARAWMFAALGGEPDSEAAENSPDS